MKHEYTVSRSTMIAAPSARIHALINDFREWVPWSPWEELDPEMERTYTGPDSGVGSRYAWSGNKKAGQGSMEITSSSPSSIEVDLAFLRPVESDSRVTFTLQPDGDATKVTWRMDGEWTGLMSILGRVTPMDKMLGKDFEKGLGKLKGLAER